MDNKRNMLLIVVIGLVLVVLGGTFAYYTSSANNNILTGNMGNVDLNLKVTKVLPNTNGVDDIIVTNFNDLASSLNSDCVYGDGEYAMCQLYKVSLSNSASGINTRVKGSIAFDNATTPNLSWLLLGNSFNTNTNYTSAMLGNTINKSSSSFANFVDSYLLETGSSIDYYILVWVNETDGEQNDEGSYSGTVRFEDANGIGVTATFSS